MSKLTDRRFERHLPMPRASSATSSMPCGNLQRGRLSDIAPVLTTAAVAHRERGPASNCAFRRRWRDNFHGTYSGIPVGPRIWTCNVSFVVHRIRRTPGGSHFGNACSQGLEDVWLSFMTHRDGVSTHRNRRNELVRVFQMSARNRFWSADTLTCKDLCVGLW